MCSAQVPSAYGILYIIVAAIENCRFTKFAEPDSRERWDWKGNTSGYFI